MWLYNELWIILLFSTNMFLLPAHALISPDWGGPNEMYKYGCTWSSCDLAKARSQGFVFWTVKDLVGGGKRGTYEAKDLFNLNEASAAPQILDPGIRFNQTTDIL